MQSSHLGAQFQAAEAALHAWMAHANEITAFYHGGAMNPAICANNQHDHMAEGYPARNESMSIDAE
eukprot:2481426-Karenia_brevis.AAC.1